MCGKTIFPGIKSPCLIHVHFSWKGKTRIDTAATWNPVDPDATIHAHAIKM
jgi:hypothetical protein